MRLFILLFILGASTSLLRGQQKQAIKLDVTALVEQNLQVAYEVRVNKNSSLEISVGRVKHNDQPDWVFNGSQTNNYLQGKIDTFNLFNKLDRSSGWYNIVSQPLVSAPENFALDSYQAQIGWRFNYTKRRSKWRFFLQPGMLVERLRYFTITTERVLDLKNTSLYYIGDAPFQQKVESSLAAYNEKRIMYQKKDWLAGISYNLGLVRRFGQHFFLEGRVQGGALISAEPYQSPKPPLKSRAFWIQPVLLAGWGF